jgi:magnesium transporter
MNPTRSEERLRESLRQVSTLLERHEVLEALAHKEQGPRRDLLESLAHRQNLTELASRLRAIHAADLAAILESLPLDKRLLVWEQLGPAQAADVLVEVGAAVREQLVARTGQERLLALLGRMDTDDLAYVSELLPPHVREAVYGSLDQAQREAVAAQYAHPDDSVGYLMARDVVAVREASTLGSALAELRGRRELPPQTDALFVVDARNVFRGLLPLRVLVVQDPGLPVTDALTADPVVFTPADPARDAAKAFERYDLVSAAVVDERGKLVGRLTVDAVMDFRRRQSELEALQRAGLAGEEDLFAPVPAAARNRWAWLAINLVTAFVASRVIGVFEHTIHELVALATLMPIVASIGGNTGNQTVALMIRGLALDQITPQNVRHLFRKELLVSLLNGAVWGGAMGLLTLLLYRIPSLSAVMAAAVALNLMVSAVVGVAVPLLLQRAGRDPAQGASVLLTFTTDGMGFFIFLGLARALIVG